MALTLAQADYLTTSKLVQAIIEEVVWQCDVLDRLPFVFVEGKSLLYDRRTVLPIASFYAVNEDISSTDPTYTQIELVLRELHAQSDISRFLRDTKSNVMSQEDAVLSGLSQAMAAAFDDTFVYGKNSADAKVPDGLHALIGTNQQVHQGSGTTGAALSLAKLDQMIDLIKPGRPDCLMMNRNMVRRLSGAARLATVGGTVNFAISEFGKRTPYWDTIPIVVNDKIVQSETISGDAYALKLTGACTTIFAIKFGAPEAGGLFGLQGNPRFEITKIDPMENKNSARYRMSWYYAVGLGCLQSLARIDGITDAAVTV